MKAALTLLALLCTFTAVRTQSSCPPGVPLVLCFVDPCTTATCPNHPTAQCISNYCGGCNHNFYDSTGTDVTNSCSTTSTTSPSTIPTTASPTDPRCPPPTGLGICIHRCSSNTECSNGQICCSNGCGSICFTPTETSTTPPPPTTPTPPIGHCPTTSSSFGACIIECSGDSECRDGRICCSNGCGGRTCVAANTTTTITPPPTSPVTATVPTVTCSYGGREYQPGETFTAADGCNTCTCTTTGLAICTRRACPPPTTGTSPPPPTTITIPTGTVTLATQTLATEPSTTSTTPTLPTATCTVGGREYAAGESFTASDGCNTCFCSPTGAVACTLRFCPPTPPTNTTTITPPTSTRPTGTSTRPTGTSTRPTGTSTLTTDTPTINPLCPRISSDQLGICVQQCRGDTDCSGGRICCPNGCGRTCATPNTTCTHQGRRYRIGETFPAGDNCNNCTCGLNGLVACTLRFCIEYPQPTQYLTCPYVNVSGPTVCIANCFGDLDCNSGQKCCSIGCAVTCVDADRVPYYNVSTQQCPDSSGLIGICVVGCRGDYDCDNGQMCCSNGCGQTCTATTAISQRCLHVQSQFNSTTRALGSPGPPLGAYIPQCDRDGNYSPVQYHEGFSWCVHTQTGLPLSGFYGRGERAQCRSCTSSGRTYYPGQTFPSSDGCNQCSCTTTGVAACTERACVDLCSLPPETGLCRGSFPAYHYDSSSGTCQEFTYGGCGGNENKFNTVRDCLQRCSPQSRCLLDPVPGVCRAYIPSYFYNATSGQCESFVYGGCGGNENRFSSGLECLRACDPDNEGPTDSTGLACWQIQCDVPQCAPGSVVVNSDAHCCPTCGTPTIPTTATPAPCRSNQFRCNNGTCIPQSWRCDILEDCTDGEDERNCDSVACDFACGDGVCLPQSYVCDGIPDCRNGRDERRCTDGQLPNTEYYDPPVTCPNSTNLIGTCDERCNRNGDCGGQLCCSNGCGHTCVDGEPVSPVCRAIRSQIANSSSTNLLVGVYSPQCDSNGDFLAVQCHPSTGYCWCVDTGSGWPTSQGARGQPQCGGCTTSSGQTYRIGETYTADDGCNTCICTRNGSACTRIACGQVPCMFGDQEIAHNGVYEDECSQCSCRSGVMDCMRRNCGETQPLTSVTKVTMPFDGDFNMIAQMEGGLEDFKREVKRTMITEYKNSMGLTQSQLTNVEVKSGSVIVIVDIAGSGDQTNGANVTILLLQLQQDYESGIFIIRHNSTVYVPSGQFSTSSTEQEAAVGLFWWHILLIAVAAVAVIVAIIAVIFAGVVCMRKGSRTDKPYASNPASANENDYEIAYRRGEENVDVKQPLDYSTKA